MNLVPQTPQTISSRIPSIDILRGLVMVIMAIDHIREYWSSTPFRPEDLTQTTTLFFLSRWVTHFCAPIFVFLAGIGIFLYQQKKNSRRDTVIFLLTRGAWLVVLEVLVVSFLLQFNYDFILIQVIWIIGWSMILLAGLLWLPRWFLIAFVVLLIGGHNLFSDVQPVTGNFFLAMLHNTPFVIPASGAMPTILFAYAPIPWVAVLVFGYLVGEWFTYSQERQKYLFRAAGISMISFFILLRATNIYGDFSLWSVQPRGFLYTIFSFVNVSKYPPSLLFLSLTIGAGMFLLSVRGTGQVGRWLGIFGQVPFFYYLLHLLLISGGARIWTFLAFGKSINLGFTSPADFPASYHPSIVRTYFVWAVVVFLLYFPCRWYANFKKTHHYWWLGYL